MSEPRLSPAHRQANQTADIEWVSQALYETLGMHKWEEISNELRDRYRATVKDLLHRGVIKCGRRWVDPPMTNQSTIDDYLEPEVRLEDPPDPSVRADWEADHAEYWHDRRQEAREDG